MSAEEHNDKEQKKAFDEAADKLNRSIADEMPPPKLAFPVVGIGASAGGLEAYSEFLQSMPSDSGMAFVLIQHLSPKHESMVANILARQTSMPVQQVEDGVPIEPNHVYVIRPGHTMTIEDGRLRLGVTLLNPGHRRPVDDFFRSLASEQRERAIAIIMSGMGSNGTAGAQAIKAVGGICIAQEPDTCKFPSMPRSLIDAGYADFILKPAEMPDRLMRYASHPYAKGGHEATDGAKAEQNALDEILNILRSRIRNDYRGYKKPTVLRRIQRRMGLSQLTKMADYARALRQNPAEVQALSDDLLIHVTGFFRDAAAWDSLREKVLLPMMREKEDDSTIRCWVTACSSGEEAYSLAMLLIETAEALNKHFEIKVFATDTADRSLVHARAGVFPGGIESEIEPSRLARFFEKDDAFYHVKPELRELVVFAPQNLLEDPPFSRIDIITCRNLLIYLEPELQQKVLGLVHFGLREGGALMLGTSETPSGNEELFESIDKAARLYRRIGPTRHARVSFPAASLLHVRRESDLPSDSESRSITRSSIPQITSRLLLENFAPASVVVDRQGRVVFFHGNTDPFLAQPRGEPTRELLLISREAVRGAVRAAFHKSLESGETVVMKDGTIESEDGRLRVEVSARPLEGHIGSSYFLVSFSTQQESHSLTQPVSSDANEQTAWLEEELVRVRDELQNTVEELQTSNEELKASNEEVTSVNEELQSTNEELETSKEELQSLNEELSTVNSQLQAKMLDLERTTNDLASLLTSTDIAVVFLDTKFRIRRFTPAVKHLIDILASDIGRPLRDLAPKFDDPDLMADTQSVLERLIPIEKEISVNEGKYYVRQILPYRTSDNRIDGVVLTFVDITRRRLAEGSVRASEAQFRAAIQESPNPVIMYADDGEILQLSRTWMQSTGLSQSELPTLDAWLQRVTSGADELREKLMDLFSGAGHVYSLDFSIRTRSGTERRWSLNASVPGLLPDGRRFAIGMVTDLTEKLAGEQSLSEERERLRAIVDGPHDFVMIMFDTNGYITAWNTAAQRILQHSDSEAIGQHGSLIFTEEDRASGVPQRELSGAARTGRALDERWHVRKDGTRFWGSGVMTALRTPDGALRGFVKVLRDETIRKQSQELLRVAKEEAETASRAKDEFLAVLSHELRTPLAAIMIWTKLLKNPALTSEQHAEGVDAIQRSADAQKQLVDDLLDSSRIVRGELRLDMHETDLQKLVRSAVDSIVPTANTKNIQIETELQDGMTPVLVDSNRLRQVIWNLLTNAIKFTPSGGLVAVRLLKHSQDIELRVSDNGQGVTAEFLPHMFEAFRQDDSSMTRRAGGLGLGLAIVKQLVELHGGRITAHSDGPGKGATFIVRLPLAAVNGASEVQVTRPTKRSTVDPNGKGLQGVTVLVVEDQPDSLAAIAMVLRSEDATVFEASSASDGLEILATQRPTIIISDIGMPVMNGFEFMQRVRSGEATAHSERIPSIALTAFTRDEDQQLAYESGFDRFLGKPFEPDSLLQVIREMIAARRDEK